MTLSDSVNNTMDILTCFLCEKDVHNLQNPSIESQKHAFEEHLSDVHEAIFDVDYLFTATKLKLKQRHQVFVERFGVTPANFIEKQVDAPRINAEIKEDMKTDSGFNDNECKTRMGKIITDFKTGRQCQYCEQWSTRPWCLKEHYKKCSIKNKFYDTNSQV